ncbi:hypothetical protein SDC9_184261 [bioreactor metagenome]|uniref:Uncharacterized protein n=1 Tax=bioreactor metagenome TaxID=1076179 RepID=A0A645HDE8_9ZZZZ
MFGLAIGKYVVHIQIAAHHCDVVLIDQHTDPRIGHGLAQGRQHRRRTHQIAYVVAADDQNIHLLSPAAADCSVNVRPIRIPTKAQAILASPPTQKPLAKLLSR